MSSMEGVSNSIQTLLSKLLNPGAIVDARTVERFSLASLSSLAPFLWRVMPLIPADKDDVKMLSKPEFVELACDKWLRSHEIQVEPAARILYHLMNMSMHANLLVIQSYAHQASKEFTDKGNSLLQACVLRWTRGRHFPVAKWHAQRILETVDQASNVSLMEGKGLNRRDERQGPALTSELKFSKRDIEMVHVPYAIYYATLVLWCGTLLADGRKSLSASSYLARGRNLLSMKKLRVAVLLEHVLSKLEMARTIDAQQPFE